MDSGKISNRDMSSTFIKGISVLKSFDDRRTRLTLSEIAHSAGLDRASARRLTLTLLHLGYVKKEGRHFSLTPRILVLAGSFLRGNHFGTHIQPLLNRYAIKMKTSVSLAILDDAAAVYVAQSTTSEEDVSFGFTIGSRLPLLHSAVGRMMLAYSDLNWSQDLIQHASFESYTSETIMDRAKIQEKIQQARENGYSIVAGEFEAGITGFAVPIGNISSLKAVVGIAVPSLSVGAQKEQDEKIIHLQELASDLGRTPAFTSF